MSSVVRTVLVSIVAWGVLFVVVAQILPADGPSLDLVGGLLAYMVVMVAIGIHSSRYVKDLDDFLLAGRRLGPWVTAISERASGESAWFLMGLPGAAYAVGFREFWSVIGIAFGIFASWLLIALPLRRASEKLGALTLPDYFASRYPDLGRLIRIVATVAIVVFYVTYLGAQILGAGKLFQNLFGFEQPYAGALIGACIVVAYTLLGGFLAVAWTDLLQGLMMMMVAIVLPLIIVAQLGLDGIREGLSVRPGEFFAMGNFALDQAVKGLGFGAIIGSLAWGFGYLGQPHLLTRYMAIAKPEEIRRARTIAMGWVLIAYWGITMVGILAVAVLGPDIKKPDTELVIAQMADHLLPGWLAGLVIAGILAAIMSTADSQLLVATSAIVEDFIIGLFGVRLTKKQVVRISREVTVLVTLVALYLIMEGSTTLVYGIVAYAWTGLGATFGPALILALWWKRTTGPAVLAGMVTGIVATIAWKNLWWLQGVDLKLGPVMLATAAVLAVSLCSSDSETGAGV